MENLFKTNQRFILNNISTIKAVEPIHFDKELYEFLESQGEITIKEDEVNEKRDQNLSKYLLRNKLLGSNEN